MDTLREMMKLVEPSPVLTTFQRIVNESKEIRVTPHTPFPDEVVKVGSMILIHPAVWNQYILPYLDFPTQSKIRSTGTLWGLRVYMPSPPPLTEEESNE